jgi:hypothetical protein
MDSSARQPLAPQLAKWRAIKSKAEQEVMRHAADISARAHTKVNKEPYHSAGIVSDKNWFLDNEIYSTWLLRSSYCSPFRIFMCSWRRPKACICSCRCFGVNFHHYSVLFLLLIYEQRQCSHSSLYIQQSHY